jgi:hypothetical protein
MSAKMKEKGPESAVYGLGIVGAAIYYIGAATSFLGGLWGFVKALFWPAFLVYEALSFFGA